MKKTILWSIGLMALLMLNACSSNDEPDSPQVEFTNSPDDLNKIYPDYSDNESDYVISHLDGGIHHRNLVKPISPEGREFAFSGYFFATIPGRGGEYRISNFTEEVRIEGVAMIEGFEEQQIPSQTYTPGSPFPLSNLYSIIDTKLDGKEIEFLDISSNPIEDYGRYGASISLDKNPTDEIITGMKPYRFDWTYKFPENTTGKARVFILKYGLTLTDLSIPGPDYKSGIRTVFVQLPE